MKRYFILIIAVCLLMSSFAQETTESKRSYYRHEISGNIGIGTLSGDRWFHFREQMEERFALFHENGYSHATTPIGVRTGLRYMYSINKHMSVGCQFSFFSGDFDYDYYTKEEKVEIIPGIFNIESREHDNPPSIQAKAFSTLPTVKWLYSKMFYVRGGIGVQYRKYSMDASSIDASVLSPISDSQWLFAYQIVPFGVEFSLPGDEFSTVFFKKVSPIYFHIELGYGVEGFLNIGLAYKFKRCKSK